MMKAVVVCKNGLAIEQRPIPTPKDNEVLVKVHAAALNRLDLQVAEGVVHGKSGGLGNIIGIEWSGTVVQIGKDVPLDLKVGDAVLCSGTGGYAEYAVTDWGRIHKFHDGFADFVQAAALPVALQTAHEAITSSGQFKKGQSVLVNGAGSVIGLMVGQVARLLGASTVIGTSTRTPSDRLRSFGIEPELNLKDQQWPQQVLECTNGSGVDLVIDMVAGTTLNGLLAATRVGGSIVNVGRMGGFTGELDFDLHAARRIRYIGTSFRTRSLDEVRAVAKNMRQDLWSAVSSGALHVPVSHTYAFAEFEKAHATMRENGQLGKIVLDLS